MFYRSLAISVFVLFFAVSVQGQTATPTPTATAAPFPARSAHQAFTNTTGLVVCGGDSGTSELDDVWASATGTSWVQSATLPISVRGHRAIDFEGRHYVIGGLSVSSDTTAFVYSCSDDMQWQLDNDDCSWGARSYHAIAEHDGQLFLAGGFTTYTSSTTGEAKNDVWSSPDGITWTIVSASAEWTPRYGHQMASLDGKLWVTGGSRWSGSAPLFFREVWSSTDGVTWTQSATPGWSARVDHTMVTYHSKLWVVGGGIYTAAYSDLWSTPDGETWTEESAPPWPARANHASVVYDDQIWVIGGDGSAAQKPKAMSSTKLNDVWAYKETITAVPNWEQY